MATLNSQTMTEFCEQVNPRVLLEMRRTRPFPDMLRVQESWTDAAEKRALLWLAARTPDRIGPDHLTVLGLAAQIGAGGVLRARRIPSLRPSSRDRLPHAQLAGRLTRRHAGASPPATTSALRFLR